MLILHAAWLEKALHVWGEAPTHDRDGSAAGKRRGHRSAAGHEPYSFDAGEEALVAALASTLVGFKRDRRRISCSAAWLPARASHVMASSPLVADPPASRAKARLAPRTVTTLALTPDESVELLSASMDRQTVSPGVVLGADFTYWTLASRFAGAMVARQQYLPDVVDEDGIFRARWKPMYSQPDAARVASLARSMPGSARALTAVDAAQPPAMPAAQALREFVLRTIDNLVRRATDDGAPTSQTPARTPARTTGRTKTKRVRRTRRPFDSLHAQWLHALRTPDATLHGDRAEIAALTDEVRAWQRPVHLTAAAPLRLCFRLEEPNHAARQDDGTGVRKLQRSAASQDPPWHVRYLLQPVDDPSLLVPAADTWNTKRRNAKLLVRDGVEPREFLLSALGQAAAICPRIEQSLQGASPAGYDLDAAGAHEFLSQRATALEATGFGVMLPAWWTTKGTKLRLAARAAVRSPRMQGGAGLSLDDLVEFQWEVALGGQKLSYRELERLARLKSPLVQVRGQWVELSAADIQSALALWKKKGLERASLRDVVRMSLGAGEVPGGMEFDSVRATGWLADLLEQLTERSGFAELPAPDGFSGTLRPYQTRGYSWLAFLRRWQLGTCLADDMGLGKTIQALALVQRDWETHGKQPVLLVCPMSVVGNWRKEAERFTPHLPVLVHHGVGRKKDTAFARQARKHALVLTSYALLHRDAAHFAKVDWAGVVLDEAQNIKNPETKQARAARALRAGYRVALTGTPVENNVGDLWSIMEFLNPGWLGTQAEFKRRFFVPIQASRDAHAAEQLRRVTGPFILRRLKTDKKIIRDLPKKQEMKVFCTLTKEQASLYAAVLKDMEKGLKKAEGIQRKGLVLATLSKLKQVCNHPAQFLGDNSKIPERSGKLARLVEMLEEATAASDAALVFSQFSEMGDILKRHLEESFGAEVLFLHGRVPKKRRDRMIERFQENDGPAVFVLSLKAGGTGLNLTRANHVFHFDRWWNPAVENQATDRAFRIGQKKNVQVHKFICAGTLEERIDEMIELKKGVAEQVVGTGEAWLTKLSNEDLRDVLALRKEAVGA